MTKKSVTKRRLGLWAVGAHGGLATTMIVGAKLIAKGITSESGLITATPAFAGISMMPLDDIVFGGHDVRKSTVFESAYEIYRDNGTIPLEPLLELKEELKEVDANIRTGSVLNCGKTIQNLADPKVRRAKSSCKDAYDQIRADIADFKKRHNLDQVVVINLASTEPPLAITKDHQTPTGIERLIREDKKDQLRASTLYCMAALKDGHPFINFTPSNAAVLPGHIKLAEKKNVPIMGNDGKTGETLVKSALAPMFKYRNLPVLTWQGYNILGDRDGQVLADDTNKASKISSKDSVLSSILGYPLHTHVSIDYAPSLSDLKTAWDFIHFKGFLDYKMSLQFTWQGCDAILAAPVALDLVRLADYADRLGEGGVMSHLACFFKNPLGTDEQDLHFQFHNLMDYLEQKRQQKTRSKTKTPKKMTRKKKR